MPRIARGPTPLQLAKLLRGAAVDKKAWDAVVIDVRDKTSIADYFVVCEGETDRQVRAIADGMVDAAKDRELRPIAVDGYDDATWILLDFDSVLAHSGRLPGVQLPSATQRGRGEGWDSSGVPTRSVGGTLSPPRFAEPVGPGG